MHIRKKSPVLCSHTFLCFFLSFFKILQCSCSDRLYKDGEILFKLSEKERRGPAKVTQTEPTLCHLMTVMTLMT